MVKKNIKTGLFFFVALTIKDLVISEEIQWIDNIFISVIFALMYLFWDWSKIPYDWNKHKNKSMGERKE